MLPRVLAGSSVGSIVAGIIATRTDEELRDTFGKLESFDIGFFNNSRAVELVHHFLARGVLHDMSYLQVRGRVCFVCVGCVSVIWGLDCGVRALGRGCLRCPEGHEQMQGCECVWGG